jgi:CO/xanthine dehydrogenase FAD-binding subunit
MNLNTITEVKRPGSADQIGQWRDGYAWLAGGTWLFSEPQIRHQHADRPRWARLDSAHCDSRRAGNRRDLLRRRSPCLQGPADWRAVPLFRDCIDAFLMSFKIWNAATVGGNICMSLPAGAMISLTAALEGVCTLWPRDGQPRTLPVVDFVTGNHKNVLQKGELLRSIHLPARALSRRYAMRQMSLTRLGRSAALLVGTVNDGGTDFVLTITASTPRPVQLRFAKMPSAEELRHAINEQLPGDGYFQDVHGSARYKRHLTYYLAEQIRAELA